MAAFDAVETEKPEPEITALLAPAKVSSLEDALRARIARAQAYDTVLKPFNRTIDEIEKLVSQAAASLPHRESGVNK